MLTSLENDMIALGSLCRWQPSEIMAMSSIRRRTLAAIMTYVNRPSGDSSSSGATSKPLYSKPGRLRLASTTRAVRSKKEF